MTLRQRLPRVGSRLLRRLAAGEVAVAPAGVCIAAPATVRALSSVAGRALAGAALLGRGAAHNASALPQHSALLSLAAMRQFAAAADLPAHQELAMPALSPTMSQGNIVAWKKKEGDSVQPGDVLCEVETDKATIEWEAQEEGFLARILAPEGARVLPIGTTVAILVEEEGDVAAFKDYSGPSAGGAPAAAPAAPAAAAPAPGGAGGSFPPHQVLAMPSLSPTMSYGTLLAWKVKEGSEVSAGDVLCEVETDKATMEWESQDDGFVAKILLPEGSSSVEVGTPVIVIADSADAVPAFAGFTAADAGGAGGAPPSAAAEPAAPPPQAQAAAPAAAPAAPKPAAPAAAPRAAAPTPGGRVVASPYAKKLAAEAGISLAGAAGSGPGGRLVAADVQQLVSSGGAAPAGAAYAGGAPAGMGAHTDVPNSQIRKVTARRLVESKQTVPHYYLTVSARVDALQRFRQQLNETLAAGGGGKLSLNDFVIKASALALRKVPEANASWFPEYIRQYHNVDCSVAVQTPLGLMVPIVKDADRKGLAAIAAEVKELAGRAKEGKLRPEEFTGGTFTISNLGMYGVSQFAAIVNPPQACILAVGTTEPRVVPAAAGGFEEASYLTCTLSCDHRVIDGAVGAQWLQAFRGYLENPATMLL
ncbi:Dihydrolipoyllysine-residue acetyltransferase component of pyruvate dehydrogenase mitochondrial [Micractinium conductrix]|uniref:Acetyltransferase component of pyruvate dehydrogenase complex n=1 Tax=Micractinium conductrix TaxID=554055 RepID=A0A2P6V438_9CHLO|nr:Dihydrolipoyllysine-residue acetyltransferase component of pyruvate dehydrogenase mitochondrial [Micractinium conductrix]|eukprot:PSC68851.1 Dihydrolipoyllysine-residue acetyltransferase component of pyruvate dehydrogenase mitochondrial [Micractinium conductrix]